MVEIIELLLGTIFGLCIALIIRHFEGKKKRELELINEIRELKNESRKIKTTNRIL